MAGSSQERILSGKGGWKDACWTAALRRARSHYMLLKKQTLNLKLLILNFCRSPTLPSPQVAGRISSLRAFRLANKIKRDVGCEIEIKGDQTAEAYLSRALCCFQAMMIVFIRREM